MKRSVLSILLCAVLVISVTGSAFADSIQTQTDSKNLNDDFSVINVKKESDLSSYNSADVTKVDGTLALSTNVKRLVDKSDITIIEHLNQNQIQAIANKLCTDFYAADLQEGQKTIGAIIYNNNQQLSITEVIAEIADEMIDDKIIRTDKHVAEKFLDWLSENAEIDPNMIYSDYKSEAVESTKGSSNFGDVSKIRYLYTAPDKPDENYTEYLSAKDSSRYLLALTKVVLYGYKNKTSGTTTYDSFKAKISVTPYNDLRVNQFNGNLFTPNKTKYNILGATDLQSDSGASQTISVTLPYDITSLTGGLSYTYSYTTGGKNIKNQVPLEEYKNRWKVYPISPSKNESYSISPSMVVKTTGGTKYTNLAEASLSYIKLKKLLTAYWISDKNVVVKLYYKNHIQTDEP